MLVNWIWISTTDNAEILNRNSFILHDDDDDDDNDMQILTTYGRETKIWLEEKECNGIIFVLDCPVILSLLTLLHTFHASNSS